MERRLVNRKSLTTIVLLCVDNFIFKSVCERRHFVKKTFGCRKRGGAGKAVPNVSSIFPLSASAVGLP